MSILLPQPRLPQTASPTFLDYGADLISTMGGVAQRLNRIGGRFYLVITYPRLKPEPDGRILMAALRQAKTQGALFPVPQPGLVIGATGTPLVNGASQTGSTLNIDGFAPGYTVRNGQFFSIIYAGRRYLHHATADMVANSSGQLALPIFPMLRISPNDNAVCEFAVPYIEGFLSGNTVAVELAIAKATPGGITITEAA